MLSRFSLVLFVVVALVALMWMLGGERAGDPLPAPLSPAPEPAPQSVPSPVALEPAHEEEPGMAELTAEVLEPAPASVEEARVVLSGRLVDPTGIPVVRAELAFFASGGESGRFLSMLRMRARSRPEAEARATSEGRFHLAVPTGAAGDLVLARGSDWIFADGTGWTSPVAGHHRDTDLGDLVLRAAASFSGLVVDSESRPIVAARIRVHPLSHGGPGTVVVESAPRSNASGEFSVRGLDGGRFWIEVHAQGHVPAMRELELEAGERRAGIDFVLPRGWSVTGVVQDERGVPIAGARVRALRTVKLPSGLEVEQPDPVPVVSAADGGFKVGGLEGATARLEASATRHEDQLVDVLFDEQVRITLSRRGAILGRLMDHSGRGIEGSRLRAIPTHANPAESAARRRAHAPFTTTDAEGHFHLADVAPGEVVIHADGAGHPEVVSEPITVEPGRSVQGVSLVAERGAGLTILVADSEGVPVSNATVRVSRPAPDSSPRIPADLARRPWAKGGQTDEQGSWSSAGLPVAELRVLIEHPDFVAFGPRAVWPSRGEGAVLEVVLDRGARLDVHVVDSSEDHVVGCIVRLTGPLQTEGESSSEGRTDGDGIVSFRSLAAGLYEVTATNAGGAGRFGTASDSVRTLLPAGEHVVQTVVRATPVTLSGVIRDASGEPVVGAEVRAQEIEFSEAPLGSPRVGRSAGDGRYTIEGLVPGRWLLRFGAPPIPAHFELELDVPAGTTRLDQDLQFGGGALSVLVVDQAETPVPGAALRLDSNGGITPPWPGGRIDLGRLAHAATDQTGRATLGGLPAGEYTLHVNATGLAPARVEFVVHEGQVCEIGPVELARGGTLVLELGDAADSWGVEVRRRGLAGIMRIVPVENDAEAARLGPGNYELRLLAAPDPARPDRPATSWTSFEIRTEEETRLDLGPLVAEVESRNP